MSGLRHRTLAIAATAFAGAVILGASASVVMARDSGDSQPLFEGQNLVAGPRDEPTSASHFLECLDPSEIEAVYTWLPGNPSIGIQPRWRHYFINDEVPDWVNGAANGGIGTLTSQNAVYIIANTDIPEAFFNESPTDQCP